MKNMENKILQFRKDADIYRKLAEEKNEAGDFIGALSYLFEARSAAPGSLDVIMDIADTYADMNLPELSNRYWYLYLDRAPAARAGTAYIELAVNFFYMKKYWASGYFFHKKVEADGFISAESLDPEITEYFSRLADNFPDIKLAYPARSENTEQLIMLAEKAAGEDNFKKAAEYYARIPENIRTEEISGELAFMYFLSKQDEKSAEECRSSLARHGENVTAYCNLSALYSIRKIYDKSEYYYRKALECCKEPEKYAHKLATAAMENGDNEMTEKFTSMLIADGSFDIMPRLTRAQALINLGRYEDAKEQCIETLKIDPFNTVVKYYRDLAERMSAGDKHAKRLLPLAYSMDLQPMDISVYKRAINDYLKDGKISPVRERYLKEVSLYGESCDDPLIIKGSFMFRPTGKVPPKFGEEDFKKAFRMLLNPSVPLGVKSSLVQMLVCSGYKKRFGVVVGMDCIFIKPRKTAFDNAADGVKFLAAYAECLTGMAVTGMKDDGRLCSALNSIYKDHAGLAEEMDMGVRELAAVAAAVARQGDEPRITEAMLIFGADNDRVNEFMRKAGIFAEGEAPAENVSEKGGKDD